jgi:hypothetical protein
MARSIDQPGAELRFQRLDLPADRAVRDAQFIGGARHAPMTGEGLEGGQGAQRRQAAGQGGFPTAVVNGAGSDRIDHGGGDLQRDAERRAN